MAGKKGIEAIMNNTIVSLLCVGTLLAVLGMAVVSITWTRSEIGAGLRRWVDRK